MGLKTRAKEGCTKAEAAGWEEGTRTPSARFPGRAGGVDRGRKAACAELNLCNTSPKANTDRPAVKSNS